MTVTSINGMSHSFASFSRSALNMGKKEPKIFTLVDSIGDYKMKITKRKKSSHEKQQKYVDNKNRNYNNNT